MIVQNKGGLFEWFGPWGRSWGLVVKFTLKLELFSWLPKKAVDWRMNYRERFGSRLDTAADRHHPACRLLWSNTANISAPCTCEIFSTDWWHKISLSKSNIWLVQNNARKLWCLPIRSIEDIFSTAQRCSNNQVVQGSSPVPSSHKFSCFKWL